MSSTSSQGLAASALGLSEPGCEPLGSARSTPIAGGCCDGIGQMSLFGEMSESLPQRKLWPTPRETMWHGGDILAAINRTPSAYRRTPRLMSSAAAFPARTSASPERARALAASAAGYGRSTPELLARYDRATSSWRTSQLCLDGGLSEYSETWPRSGLMRNGTAYQLPPLVRLTDEIGSGSWLTPTARDWKGYTNRAGESICNQMRDLYGGTGSLNPTWVEWLMGYPLGWTDLEPSATPSSRRSRRSSVGRS
jgi:hypothetical protein